jgi:hypothetical protein
MAARFLTGRNLPKIMGQPRESAPSTVNEKTLADFTRVVEQTGILSRLHLPHITGRRVFSDHARSAYKQSPLA